MDTSYFAEYLRQGLFTRCTRVCMFCLTQVYTSNGGPTAYYMNMICMVGTVAIFHTVFCATEDPDASQCPFLLDMQIFVMG